MQLVSLILIHWIVIYPVDSPIQRLNNWGQISIRENDCTIHWIEIYLAPVVQKRESAIQRINLFVANSAVGFPNTYLLDSDLSGG